MNIFFYEMKATRKSLMIWSLCLIAFTLLVAWEITSYFDQPALADVLDVIPAEFAQAFGMHAIDLTQPSGFLIMTSVYFYIMLGIYAALYGNSMIAREERDKTAEFLMSMPIRREKVVAAKLLSGVLSCLVLTAVVCTTSYLSMLPFDLEATFFDLFWPLSFSYLFFMLVFLGLGAFFAAAFSAYKRTGALSVGMVIGTYLLFFISKLDESVDWLRYGSPFYYFEAARLSENGLWEARDLALCAGVLTLVLGLAFYRYPRRDLRM